MGRKFTVRGQNVCSRLRVFKMGSFRNKNTSLCVYVKKGKCTCFYTIIFMRKEIFIWTAMNKLVSFKLCSDKHLLVQTKKVMHTQTTIEPKLPFTQLEMYYGLHQSPGKYRAALMSRGFPLISKYVTYLFPWQQRIWKRISSDCDITIIKKKKIKQQVVSLGISS